MYFNNKNYSIVLEQYILGYLILNYNNIIKSDIMKYLINNKLNNIFFFKKNKFIFYIIYNYFFLKKKINLFFLYEDIKKNNIFKFLINYEYLLFLIQNTPNIFNIYFYIKILYKKYLYRNMLNNFKKIILNKKNIFNYYFLKKFNKIFFKFLNKNVKNINDNLKLKYINNIFFKFIKYIKLNKNNKKKLLKTGFKELDKKLNLSKNDFIIIAGRPSTGKTAFIINIIKNIILNYNNLPIIMFTLEMSCSQIMFRILSCLTNINYNILVNGFFNIYEYRVIKNIIKNYYSVKLFLYESISLTPNEVYLKSSVIIDKFKKNKFLKGLIIIDYLQLMSLNNAIDNNKNRVFEISNISRSLKNIAKKLNIILIVISQLNRNLELRKNKKPIMSDLKESGSIEQDADIILLMHHNNKNLLKKNKKIIEIIISKYRNGPTGSFSLKFNSCVLKFENL